MDAKLKPLNHPSVFRFTDYRTFLLAYAASKRANGSRWSYGAWARKLSLKGTASLTMVINGQRHAGPLMAKKLSRYFQFSDAEGKYFEALVELSKAPSAPKRLPLIRKLQALSGSTAFHVLGPNEFAVLSDWYFYPIRQLVRLKDFQENPKWIQEKLRIPVRRAEIQKAIATLLELGLLVRNSEGKLERGQAAIKTTDDVAQSAIKEFHKKTIGLAIQSLDDVPVDRREVRSLSLALNSERLPEAKIRLREYMTAFFEEFGSDASGTADDVFQLGFQFFPVTSNQGSLK